MTEHLVRACDAFAWILRLAMMVALLVMLALGNHGRPVSFPLCKHAGAVLHCVSSR